MRKITKWAEIKGIALAVMLVVGMMSTLAAAPSNLQKVYNEAKANYNAGNYEEAAIGFQKVLKYQPGYIYARKYLAQTEAKIKQGGNTKVSLESKLAKLKISSLEFADTDLGSAMAFLTQKSEEISGGKVVANFIYKGPSTDKKSKTITLKLSNVPLTEVIRYIGQLTDTRFKYEEFAVVGVPSVVAEKQEANLRALEAKKIADQTKPKFDDKPKDPFAK